MNEKAALTNTINIGCTTAVVVIMEIQTNINNAMASDVS